MKPERGELWWACLDRSWALSKAVGRPILVFQNDAISSFTTTIVAIPLTTSLRRSQLPSAVFIPSTDTDLSSDSVALCHQIRGLDKSRLHGRIGIVSVDLLRQVEYAILYTLGVIQPSSTIGPD